MLVQKIFTLLAVCLCCLIACKNDPASKATTTTPTTTQSVAQLPALPNDIVKDLADNTARIDYIFQELPFSMSADNRQNSQPYLTHIDVAPANMVANCKLMARAIYGDDKGRQIAEADVYYGQGCQYFVFLVKNKPTYANAMTESGIRFLDNLVSKLSQPATN